MNVQLKNLPLNEELIQAVRRWENDPAISPFITPHYVETSELPLVTESDVRESLSNPDKRNYFICVDDKPIGIASIIRDFPALLKNDGKTAWLGIYIDEPDWRNKGIGKTVMAKETADLLAELEDSKATLRREKADAEKKLAAQVRQAKKDGLVDQFIYGSVSSAYLTAVMDTL